MSQSKEEVRQREVLIQIQRSVEFFYCSIVLPGQIENETKRGVYDQRERIKFTGPLELGNGLIESPNDR